MEIRIFSIWFAKRKAKEKRDIEFELLRKLQDLNARIDAAPEGNPLEKKKKKWNKYFRRPFEKKLQQKT